jgi:hypothetical protein
MSTSKKKTIQKVSEPKARFHPGQLLYFSNWNNVARPLILQGEVMEAKTSQVAIKDSVGKITGSKTSISYQLNTASGSFEVKEELLFRTANEAKIDFGGNFLILIK